ncbi:hypothetical protein [Novosphingobium acidiphilum]|uniref:hypothetical protein n=1 Tax=Novosphingobium acidiphilum TaxID=505248 RepID=UPI0003FB124D|nr:hypothetical protein [Novosphingobium acidiphilum]
MTHRSIAAAAFGIIALFGVTTAHAQEEFYEDHPDHGLRFADMEFDMPTDPLLPSWVSFSHVIHTPAQFLAGATAKLRAAVPVGTDAAAAAGILAKAGAHCGQPTGNAMACHYRDVETPWGGEYFDAINWTITLPLANGHVADLAVARDWTRR